MNRLALLLFLSLLILRISAEEQALLPLDERSDWPTIPNIVEGPLNSTAFLSGGFDRNTNTLQLTFRENGATYQYYNVSPDVADQFFQADSHGRYFNTRIRNVGYNYKKIRSAPAKGSFSGPFPVIEVSDGDTIKVLIGEEVEPVRLMYVDTPETHNNRHDKERPEGHLAKEIVRGWLPVGTPVWLWSPAQELHRDPDMRLLAVVLFKKESEDSLQGRLIAGGWSPYWKKYNHRPAPPPQWLDQELIQLEASAKQEKKAIWSSDPVYMETVSAETKDSPARQIPEQKTVVTEASFPPTAKKKLRELREEVEKWAAKANEMVSHLKKSQWKYGTTREGSWKLLEEYDRRWLNAQKALDGYRAELGLPVSQGD